MIYRRFAESFLEAVVPSCSLVSCPLVTLTVFCISLKSHETTQHSNYAAPF